MIHLIAVKVGPFKWAIIPSDMREKYHKDILDRESKAMKSWLEGVMTAKHKQETVDENR